MTQPPLSNEEREHLLNKYRGRGVNRVEDGEFYGTLSEDNDKVVQLLRDEIRFQAAVIASRITGEPADDLLATDPYELVMRAGRWVENTLLGPEFRKKAYRVYSDERLEKLRDRYLTDMSLIHSEIDRRGRERGAL